MVRRPALRSAPACCVILALCLAAPPPPARAATPEEIEAAIARGQEYLLKEMKAPGRWERDAQRNGAGHEWERGQGLAWGGITAIATYALLASGRSPQDKEIAAAIEFLKTADIVGAYSLGVRAQVWSYLPQTKETKALFQADLKRLLLCLNNKGPGSGLWDYDTTPNGPNVDHSVSQYGVLGVWACAQGGAEVNSEVWQRIDETWKKHQYKNGGWSYNGTGKDEIAVSHTMTAAGVATLFITQDYLRAAQGLSCTGNASNDHIERGLKWLSDNFAGVGGNMYLWYGIERIGAASGRKYFGDKDWYALGAENVVRTQQKDGSWAVAYKGVPDTAFALLFLSRGRAPIVMNKLDHSLEPAEPAGKVKGSWNQRPRDVANITKWIGRHSEKYLTWQVVNLKANAQDLLDAPILYISGSDALNFPEPELAKLRQFVEDGGLILGNADCGKEAFAASFRKLGTQLFPKYEFREIPPGHPIFTGQQFRPGTWKEQVSLQGISNGSRELMLLIPAADAGRYWQQRQDRTKEHLFQLASNIYLYAIDKKLNRYKGDTHLVKDKGVQPERQVKVARIEVGANWDPEPGGWRRLALAMKNEHKVGVTTEPVKLGAGKLSGTGATIAHLTGTGAFKLDTHQRKELKDFVVGGGTLVVDAAGGSSPFAESAEQQLAAMFGTGAARQLATPVPGKHPLYTNAAAPITRVAYRQTAVKKLTGNLKGPRVKGIEFAGRIAVFFSREDLSTGLVGHAVDGVIGYEPVSATAIMRNVILYAMAGGKLEPPAPPPPPAPALADAKAKAAEPAPAAPAPASAPAAPAPATPAPAAAAPAPAAPAATEGDGLD